MTAYYPAFLDLCGRLCVVIGGNTEAHDKVMRLLDAGAVVVVVSPEVTGDLKDLDARGFIEWRRRPYGAGDLKGAFLAVASPDARAANAALWKDAERERVLLNAMDDTAHCHFIAPAILERGDITVAVSTAGQAPALAVRLRDWFGTTIGPEHATLVELLGELRAEVRRRLPDLDDRRELWYRMVDSEAIEYLRDGDVIGARGHLLGLLSHACGRREAVAGGPAIDRRGDG